MKAIATNSPSLRSGLLLAIAGASGCGLLGDSRRELARVDAETFESVVRAQLPDSGAGTLGFLRVDSRPGADNPLPSTGAAQSPALVLPDSGESPSAVAADRIIRRRTQILNELGVASGGPFNYPECGGTRRVRDPDGLVGTVKCPREPLRYVAVSLPSRGAAPILAKLRRPEVPAPDSTAELWTVLVSETNTGPAGQRWEQYAWLFHRDQETGRLAVTERFLVSWAD